METYVSLVRLRENNSSSQSSSTQGPSQIAQEIVKQNGGNVVSADALLGFYDLCIRSQFPDKKSALQAFTTLKLQHNWITETHQSEPLDSFDQIFNKAQRESSNSGTRR